MKYTNSRDQNEPHFTMLCNKYYNCLNNYCSLLHLALLGIYTRGHHIWFLSNGETM